MKKLNLHVFMSGIFYLLSCLEYLPLARERTLYDLPSFLKNDIPSWLCGLPSTCTETEIVQKLEYYRYGSWSPSDCCMDPPCSRPVTFCTRAVLHGLHFRLPCIQQSLWIYLCDSQRVHRGKFNFSEFLCRKKEEVE